MQLLELTLPLDHQWMPDLLFPTTTHFTLAPRQQAEKGITLGIDSGTCLLMPCPVRSLSFDAAVARGRSAGAHPA